MAKAPLLLTSLLLILSIQGCATKNYGRQSAVTGYEREAMSCDEIDREISKVVGFVDDINKEGDPGGSAILASLENRWIGNTMERSAALESANVRMVQLWNLRDGKKCTGTGKVETRTFPVHKPEVEERF